MKEELVELIKSHYPNSKVNFEDVKLLGNNMIMLSGWKDGCLKKVIYELVDYTVVVYDQSFELSKDESTKWKSIIRGAKLLQLEEE